MTSRRINKRTKFALSLLFSTLSLLHVESTWAQSTGQATVRDVIRTAAERCDVETIQMLKPKKAEFESLIRAAGWPWLDARGAAMQLEEVVRIERRSMASVPNPNSSWVYRVNNQEKMGRENRTKEKACLTALQALVTAGGDPSPLLPRAMDRLDFEGYKILVSMGADPDRRQDFSKETWGMIALATLAGRGGAGAEEFDPIKRSADAILGSIKSKNSVDSNNETILFHVIAGRKNGSTLPPAMLDVVIEKTLDAGVDPSVISKRTKGPAGDLYRGSNREIIRRLMLGRASPKSSDQTSNGGGVAPVSNFTPAIQQNASSVAGEWQGGILIEKPRKQKISLTGLISSSGDAIFSTSNGVRSAGAIELANDSQVRLILKNRAPAGKTFANGTTEMEITMVGKIDADTMSGDYSSGGGGDSGTFVFCKQATVQSNPACKMF